MVHLHRVRATDRGANAHRVMTARPTTDQCCCLENDRKLYGGTVAKEVAALCLEDLNETATRLRVQAAEHGDLLSSHQLAMLLAAAEIAEAAALPLGALKEC